PTAVPDWPLRLAGFRDRHRPERHGRARGDALRSSQPRASVRGRYRRRRHPYPLSRRPRPCRVERQIQSSTKHDEPGAHLTNGCAIVLAEVTNRLVVTNKLARQPHSSFPKIISARSSGAVRTRLACVAACSVFKRGSLGSYRGALDLRWDRSASYWICHGVGGPARSRRGQCWTAGRVCTLFSFRNDPPEDSRSPCVARARGELGNGVCFRTYSRRVGATGSRRGQCWTAGRVCTLFSFRNDPPEESRSPCVAHARGELGNGVCFRTYSRRVGATGVNEPPRFFRRAFPLRPETRFIRRALCGRGHLCRRDGGRRE